MSFIGQSDSQVSKSNPGVNEVQRSVLRKTAWPMIPILTLPFVFNYIDRTSVGFAELNFCLSQLARTCPMDSNWLKDFLAVLDEGSFSRAAERRAITQPAFSRRIRALEEWVGASLFDRTTHRIRLTA